MIKSLFPWMLLMAILTGSTTCGDESGRTEKTDSNTNMAREKILIKVNNRTFTASLVDNQSSASFRSILPLTLSMIELNGNEKYCELSTSFPADPTNPGTIRKGDLMLYGSNTLVLFYKTFTTTYRYTKLGTVDDANGLESALGSGNVSISFAAE